MNTMSYKGYTARIEYDERDNIFVGRVLGLRSIISAMNLNWLLTISLMIATSKVSNPKNPLPASLCFVFHLKFTARP
jgi:hypothetical protein